MKPLRKFLDSIEPLFSRGGRFEKFEAISDQVFFIPGVDRASVRSIFTPNVRFVEVVEDGFAGGNVIPADFEPTTEGLAKVRENILKSNYMGRLVANDFSAAIVVAELLDDQFPRAQVAIERRPAVRTWCTAST